MVMGVHMDSRRVGKDVVVSYYIFVFEGSGWMVLLAWKGALITRGWQNN